MRFVAGGPIIPDDLLAERDSGRLVFLRGAGVSVPAGMPTFPELAKYVIEKLSPSRSSEIMGAFAPWVDAKNAVPPSARTSLDQVFNLLQQEFGRAQVNRFVHERLHLHNASNVDPEYHRIVNLISSNTDGTPQVVTTNFDRLFEIALRPDTAPVFSPPTFPEIRHDVSITGISYLHGRLADQDETKHDYVLSSSDFGRAYLAQGWASSFVRALLEKYTVVLLGYQAEDPPVKYLLQGLNTANRSARRLFAFDQGAPDRVKSKWKDRGVVPIAYPESEKHSSLWDSLKEWSVRAKDPTAWRQRIVDLAQRGPRNLEAHQRGLVAHIARVAHGAKAIADADPPVPIEWICVFDRGCRLDTPASSISGDDQGEAPQLLYGLDDDPIQIAEEIAQRSQTNDMLSWRQGDDSIDHTTRLHGGHPRGHEPVPFRLFQLARWMAKHVGDPTLAWWVARQPYIHPVLYEQILRRIRDDALDVRTTALWDIVLEANRPQKNDPLGDVWFDIKKRINRTGWSSNALREFEDAFEPVYKLSRPYGRRGVVPPTRGWPESFMEITNIDVEFPARHGEQLEVPDAALLGVVSALQRNLIRASDRLKEFGSHWFRLETLYPLDDSLAANHVSDQDAYLAWFVELFTRLSGAAPRAARALVELWPEPDEMIFDTLRLYAWSREGVFNASEVVTNVCALSSDEFWRTENERELMILLSSRWVGIEESGRAAILDKLLAGRDRYENETDDEYRVRCDSLSVARISWLDREGCDIPQDLLDQVARRKEALPNWNEDRISSVADTQHSKGGWVRTDDTPDVLDDVPIWDVVRVVQEQTKLHVEAMTEYRPFDGYVKKEPAKALLALCAASKQGNYPPNLWRSLLSNWPEGAPTKANFVLRQRMLLLPRALLADLRWEASDWLGAEFPGLYNDDPSSALELFDELLRKLFELGPDAMESAIGGQSTAEREINPSRRTYEYALNSIVRRVWEGLLEVLKSIDRSEVGRIPDQISRRMRRLLDSPGEGAYHAAANFSRYLEFLNGLDSGWVAKHLIPLFDIKHDLCEAAWSGILSQTNMVSPPLFHQVKKSFLVLHSYAREWGWDDLNIRHILQWLLLGCIFKGESFRGIEKYETRDVLRDLTSDELSHAIWFLGRIGQENSDGWEELVIPFIADVWPRESRYQTESTTQAWIALLDLAGEHFSGVYDCVKEHLRHIDTPYYDLYRFHNSTNNVEPYAVEQPEVTLDLLDRITPQQPNHVPYDLTRILDLISEVKPVLTSDAGFIRLRELAMSR